MHIDRSAHHARSVEIASYLIKKVHPNMTRVSCVCDRFPTVVSAVQLRETAMETMAKLLQFSLYRIPTSYKVAVPAMHSKTNSS